MRHPVFASQSWTRRGFLQSSAAVAAAIYGLPGRLADAAEIPDQFDGSKFRLAAPEPNPKSGGVLRYGILMRPPHFDIHQAGTIAVLGAAGAGDALASGSWWTVAHAESQVRTAPPPLWSRRGWDVVAVACDGVGAGRRRGAGHLYADFSCEISVVKPSSDCESSGIYFCVAAFEATALQRTLHVIDGRRYALYRQS